MAYLRNGIAGATSIDRLSNMPENALNLFRISLNRCFMNDQSQTQANVPPILRVAAGEDLYGEYRGRDVSYIAFKVCPPDSTGVLVLENTLYKKRGPARHLH